MSHVFISYCHDDGMIANKLANDLLDQNYNVWIDNLNLPGGSRWEDDILKAIDECEYFLTLWSANIEGSSFSQKELKHALDAGKIVIPIIISGDPDRMWPDLKSIQYIDLRDYRSGFHSITQQISLPEGVQPPPDIQGVIKRGDMKFNSALRVYRSKLSYGTNEDDAVGLLIERSEHGIQTFLVGRRGKPVQKPDIIQVFMNFSGNIAGDRFADYLEYASEIYPTLWTVLVRGAITTTPKGLQYMLPDDKRVWETAVQLAWRAVGAVSSERTPLHLYMNAPVALGAGFCAMEHFRREVFIYHTNFTPKSARERYSLVFQF